MHTKQKIFIYLSAALLTFTLIYLCVFSLLIKPQLLNEQNNQSRLLTNTLASVLAHNSSSVDQDKAVIQQILEQTVSTSRDIAYAFITDHDRKIQVHTFNAPVPRDVATAKVIADSGYAALFYNNETVHQYQQPMGNSNSLTLHIGIRQHYSDWLYNGTGFSILILTLLLATSAAFIPLAIDKLLARISRLKQSKTGVSTGPDPQVALQVQLDQLIHERTMEYKRAKEEAEFNSQAKSTFLSRMSHEIRTPMNAILGFAQLMEMDNSLRLNPQLKDNLSEILSAGNHLLHLINEILDLARIESGKMTLSIEPVQFDLVLQESLPLLEPLTNRYRVTIINNINHVLWLHVDRVRIKQIMINLLSNAVKYNRQGGTVTIDAHSHDNMTRIEITDTGYGIDKDHLNALFSPFERFTNAENTEGTGIGLNITRSLVELMGGRLGVDSTPEEGSTFWFEMANSHEPDFLDNSDEHAYTNQQQEGNSRKVIYVDDNPANRKLAQRYMQHFSEIEFHVASNGYQGLEMIRDLSPCLILLDINLPDINGISLMKMIRSNITHKTPVIAISASTVLYDVYNARRIGFDDYLSKPVCFNDFVRLVNQYVPDIRQKNINAA